MKWKLGLLCLLFFATSQSAMAQEMNVGFVQGLWYSKAAFFANQPVRIYVAFRNNTEYALTATIQFTDNNTQIGTEEISALPGRLVESWADWTPTYGKHTVKAALTHAQMHKIGEGPQNIDTTNIVVEDTLTIDYDTDGDGIGNATDTDDDGDGILDTVEIANGTDPLVPNTPEQTTTDTTSSTTSNQTTSSISTLTDSSTGQQPQGLEQFIGEGTANDVLTNISHQITSAKQSLDSYRDERNTAQKNASKTSVAKSTSLQEATNTTTDATITRTKIAQKPGLFVVITNGVTGLVQVLYTLLLFILSVTLAHPVLVQLLLLFGLLFGVYKLAKRYGRRKNQ